MADWVDITDAQVDPDAPLTSELAYAWRDNVIAMTEGAVGAPRIVDAALDTTATNDGRDWVANRIILAAAGAVGTYTLATRTSGTGDVAQNATLAGSSLSPTGGLSGATAAPGIFTLGQGSALSGTWKCMANYAHINGPLNELRMVTLWLRIA